ncbi:hypothetical protein [Streptomyces sp. NPDC058867]|uniref:hypothetical protein n=1 Tax=unclassified Streptomyces TaxID=2593676 RepID=UPI0036A99863
MPQDKEASPARKRLTKERPEARLAKDVAQADLALRNMRHGSAGNHPSDTDLLWAELVQELRRLLDRFKGRQGAPGMSAPNGAEASYAPNGSYAPAAQYSPTATPRQPHPGEVAAQQYVAELHSNIDRLPRESRMAFEDAMLDLVRTDATVRAAFEQSPESIPTIAKYAVNAHHREALRAEPTAEAAMNTARDTIMARDAEQFAAMRQRLQRPAQAPRAAPEVPHVLSPAGQTVLHRQVEGSQGRAGNNPRQPLGRGNGAVHSAQPSRIPRPVSKPRAAS